VLSPRSRSFTDCCRRHSATHALHFVQDCWIPRSHRGSLPTDETQTRILPLSIHIFKISRPANDNYKCTANLAYHGYAGAYRRNASVPSDNTCALDSGQDGRRRAQVPDLDPCALLPQARSVPGSKNRQCLQRGSSARRAGRISDSQSTSSSGPVSTYPDDYTKLAEAEGIQPPVAPFDTHAGFRYR
jgi:hypothetical protein